MPKYSEKGSARDGNFNDVPKAKEQLRNSENAKSSKGQDRGTEPCRGKLG